MVFPELDLQDGSHWKPFEEPEPLAEVETRHDRWLACWLIAAAGHQIER